MVSRAAHCRTSYDGYQTDSRPGRNSSRQGFLLNHVISDLLPERGDGHRYGNSDPVTGQAAWYDLRVRIEKVAPGAELSEPQFAPLPLPPHLPKRPDILKYGADFRTANRGSGQ